jgi:hypothetical protein
MSNAHHAGLMLDSAFQKIIVAREEICRGWKSYPT